MKRNLLTLAFTLSGIAVAGASSAGSTGGVTGYSNGAPDIVTINTTTRTAQGMMASAYNTGGSDPEYVGCSITESQPSGNTGTTSFSSTCFAEDQFSTSASCVSSSPVIAQAIGAMTTDAQINFQWDTSGNCTDVTITIQSQNQPR